MLRASSPILFFCGFAFASCISVPQPPHSYASGTISGRVIDAQGHGVAGAHVTAERIYSRAFALLPAPNAIVVAQTTTRRDGTFTLRSDSRVDALSANTHGFRLIGRLDSVSQQQNIIRVR